MIGKNLTLQNSRSIAARHALWACWLLLATVILLLPTAGRAASNPEVGGGQLLMRTLELRDAGSATDDTASPAWTPAMQLGTRVAMEINGLVAKVTVEQRFRNTSKGWVEGNYLFPLPETAAVNAMTLHIGERIIVGEIHEKQAAKKIYSEAKAAGKRTALTEQRRANLFANRIANIGPGEEISVTLTYLERVRFEQGRFSLRFPMTITPRYIPGEPLAGQTENGFSAELARSEILQADPASGWALPTDQVPDAHEISPYLNPVHAGPMNSVNPVQITATLAPGVPLANISSAYHNIVTDRRDSEYRIRLQAGIVPMNRDFELTWQPVASATPQAAVFTETVGDEHYALLMVLPPGQAAPATRLPREIIFIIDTSGSMSGTSIEQARAALSAGLATLAPNDRFNIIAFNDSPTALFTAPQLAAGAYLQDAQRFVAALEADGGTEMAAAIELALAGQGERRRDSLRQVVFITDGAVGNEAALFRQVNATLGQSRLFTVGIGSAPNSYFMRKAAQFGRGSFTYIGAATEVATRMSELFTQLQSPVLRDIDVAWPGKATMYPEAVPDLYQGQPLVVTAKLDRLTGYRDSGVRISGTQLGGDWKQLLRLGTDSSAERTGVATLWAWARIEALEDRLIAEGDSDDLRSAIIDVALLHQLVSRYTSFVAVDKTPARPVDSALHTRQVANARPAGQLDQPFAYPQTATTSVQQLQTGMLCLLLAMKVWWLRRRTLRQRAVVHAGARA